MSGFTSFFTLNLSILQASTLLLVEVLKTVLLVTMTSVVTKLGVRIFAKSLCDSIQFFYILLKHFEKCTQIEDNSN